MKRRIALLTALLALAVPVSLGVASTGSTVTVPIQKHNNDCTWDGTHKTAGTARFTRNKDGSVTIKVLYRGDVPGDISTVQLNWGLGPSCNELTGSLGTFQVKSDGTGGKTYLVPASLVAGYHQLYLFLYSTARGDYDRTDVANV